MTDSLEPSAVAATHHTGARGPRRARLAPLAAVVVGVLLVAGALVLHLTAARPAARPAAVPVVDRGSLAPSVTTAPIDHAGTARQTVHHLLPAGSRLRYARLGVDAPIIRVTVSGGVMDVPRDPATLGWWAGGAAPGDPSGTTVLVGHINYAGTTGAFAVLPRARPGDPVTVVEPSGPRPYRVTAVRTYPKTRGIPAAAFARDGDARLVLITCGGPFDPDSGNYEDNIVVYADPA